MITEDKKLLLKDICARLPHELWVNYEGKEWLVTGYGHGRVSLLTSVVSSACGPCPLIEEVKPYLKPMSSITDEDKQVINSFASDMGDKWFAATSSDEKWFATIENNVNSTDYLYSKYFDIHNLIEKGLALKAPEGMYKNE